MDYITEPSEGYELLDSGAGEKLERFGRVILRRPDSRALWPKTLSESGWQMADAFFVPGKTAGSWKKKSVPEDWPIDFAGNVFSLKLMPSKHVGLFPEQAGMWQEIGHMIEKVGSSGRKISVLNLFGYTGGVSMVAARAGAEVTHVDALQSALDWTKKNSELSGLSSASIRLMLDDAGKFVEREIRRGKQYDMVVLDPPVYGKGPKTTWHIETDLMSLLLSIKKVLSDNPRSIILNGYAAGYSPAGYARVLELATVGLIGTVSCGEYFIRESTSKKLLPAGIFAVWKADGAVG